VKNKSAQRTHLIILVNYKTAHSYTCNEAMDFYLLASAQKKNSSSLIITTYGKHTNEKLKKKMFKNSRLLFD